MNEQYGCIATKLNRNYVFSKKTFSGFKIVLYRMFKISKSRRDLDLDRTERNVELV